MALYLVTGGAGFIGSHLTETLRARGETVRVLDDLSTGRRENLPADVQLIVGDVADRTTVDHAMAGADGCFHLAAIASVARGLEDWLGTHRTNLTGTITVFDAARESRIPVVYASSAAVYGDCALQPISETAPTAPLSAYGADKLGCELHARVAAHAHGIPTVGLRFFNVYGPRQDPGSPYSGVISIFCGRLVRGASVDIFGDGQQTRDFVFVADAVAALLAAMQAAPAIGIQAPVFNVCTGAAISVLELAHTIGRLAGHAPLISHGPPRQGDIRVSVGAREGAVAALGLGAPTALSTGLASVLAWLGSAG
jgi:UDP-glucose 4-epimerase